MFKRLRNRFLIVNLVSISIMMLVAFVTIYTITYQNVQRETNMELFKVSDFYHGPYSSVVQMPRDESQSGGTETGTNSESGVTSDAGTHSGSTSVPSSGRPGATVA